MSKAIPLRDCQKKAIDYGMAHPYSIIAADPGLGKSRMAIEIRERRGEENCLIVCPAHLIANWKNQISLWAPKGRIVTAIQSGKGIPSIVDSDYVIVSYDLARKAEEYFEWADMVVLDEAHYLKSLAAKRTQFIHKNVYENSLKSVLMLTGTPIKNRVAEFYSLLCLSAYDPNAADSRFLEKFPTEIDFADHFSFRHEYTMEVGNRRVRIVKWAGMKNIPELKEWLKGKYLRLKGDNELPPISYKDVVVSDVVDHQLEAAFNAFFLDEGKDGVNPTAKAEAALRKVGLTVKYVKDLLEEVDSVVVFTDHVQASNELAKAFNTVALNGEMSAKTRAATAKKFQDGEGKVLVATIPALKEGIDLVRSHHLILNDYCWTPGDLKQVVHRIRRISQTKHCIVHRIIGSPQDHKIMKALDEKMAVIERVT